MTATNGRNGSEGGSEAHGLPYRFNSVRVTDRHTVKRWFSSPVAKKWENVLSIYFEQLFFYVGVVDVEDVARVVFKGNPTRWDTNWHRIYLDFKPNGRLDSFSMSLRKVGGDGQVRVSFPDISSWRITQTPETILQNFHASLSR